jgi:transposase-like protein
MEASIQMRSIRRKHDPAFKAKVAIEATKNEKTISQLSNDFGVHPNQISQWKKILLQEAPNIFLDKRKKVNKDSDALISELYRQIGQLKVELDQIKKTM